MSSDLSAEITAIATVVLAIFAIVTAWYARRAFLKQSQEVLAIERQVKDQEVLTRQQAELLEIQSGQLEVQRQQLNDQRAEQRRAQASRILISAEPRPDPRTSNSTDPISATFVTVRNTSLQPIYDLRFLFREADGEWTQLSDPPDQAEVLLPGEHYEYPFSVEIPYVNFMLDPSLVGAGVIFRDASGVHWRLYSDGRLGEEPAAG
jgi:hypothetical protein